VEDARQEASRVGAAARREAQERVVAAREAADEALADARAVSEGLRELGSLLGGHSERILRDVTNAHRAMAASLRVAASNANTGALEPPRAALARGADSHQEDDGDAGDARILRESRRRRTPDFEPPTWVDQ
jgi:hypothetical protein